MRLNLLVLVIACFHLAATAQAPKWLNYANDLNINHITFEGPCAWVAVASGIIRIIKI